MKDYHHQTPRKEQQHSRSSEMANRRSKDASSMAIIPEQAKKPHKLTKKNLNVEFTAVSEDIFSPASKESELSPVSEVSDGVVYSESFKASQNPELEIFDPELTPSSTITTDHDEGSSDLVNQFGAVESDCLQMKSVEAEVVVDHVEQALFRIMNSSDVDRRSKKLVEALINIVMEDFKGFPEERDLLSELVTARNRIMLICLVLWIIVVLVVFFMNTGGCNSFSEPSPT